MANPFEKRATEYLRDDEAGFLSLVSPEPLRTYLEENVAATKVQLSKSDLARIAEVAPKGFAAGGRYHDMSTVNV